MAPTYSNLLLGLTQPGRQGKFLSDKTQNSELIIGVAGSGKSQSYAIPNLISYAGSMFVMDFNDELTKATALYRAHVLGQTVLVGDPMRTVDPRWLPKLENGEPAYLTINFIDFLIRSKHPRLLAFGIAEILFPVNALREPHWAEGAQARFVAVMLFVAFDEVIESWNLKRNMETVWLMLSDARFEEESLIEMAESDDQFVADQATAVLEAGQDNREIKGIRNHIRVGVGKIFSEPAIMDFMSSTNVNFLDLRYKRMTVYLPVPGNRVHVLAKLLGAVMKIALDEIEEDGRLAYDPTGPPMVVFQADEFPVMGRFKPFVDGIARYRGFGLKFQLFCQTLGQLADHELYGEGYKTILGNVGTVSFFGGTADYFTAETISRLCGIETRVGVGTNHPSEPGNRGSWTENTYAHSVKLPDDIMRFENPKQLILRIGKMPTEAYLFAAGQSDFPSYWGFMESLKEGRPIKWAVQMAEAMLHPDAPANDNPAPPVTVHRKGLFNTLFGKG